MAADASARLKVEGLAELKNSMSQAKAAVKALDAELAASAAAYKAGGDAEKYQQEQAKLLNEQLEAQQRVVDAAKEAMQKMKDAGQDGTAAYYSMQTAAANAQAKLYTMRSALDNLNASSKTTAQGMDGIADSAEEIGKQAGGAAGEASNLENNLSSINTNISLDKVIGGIDSITSAAKKAAKQVLEIGKDIWTTAEEAAAWADEIATSARNAGVDAETYQRWQYAAEIIDVSVDDITKAQDRLAKKREGGAKTFSIFDLGEEIDQMGRFASGLTEAEARINYFDEAGNLKSYNDILWETVSVIGKVKDENVQSTIAQGLFGKSYRELTGLFKDGALEDWNKAMEEASVLTNEQIAKQTGLSDTLALMNMSYDTAKMAIFAALAPSMQKIAEAFTDIFQSVSDWAGSESGQKAIEGIGDSIASIVTSFTEEDLTGALEKAQGFLEKVSDGFANFKDNKDAIVTGIETCFGVFAGLKLVGDALKVVQFVESVKNIFGKTASVAVSGDANVIKLATEGIGASSGLTTMVAQGFGADDVLKALNSSGIGADDVLKALQQNGLGTDDVLKALKNSGIGADDVLKALNEGGVGADDVLKGLLNNGVNADDVLTALKNSGLAADTVLANLQKNGVGAGADLVKVLSTNLKGEVTAAIDPATGEVISAGASTLTSILGILGAVAADVAVMAGIAWLTSEDQQAEVLEWFADKKNSDDEFLRFIGDTGSTWYTNLVRGLRGEEVHVFDKPSAQQQAAGSGYYVYNPETGEMTPTVKPNIPPKPETETVEERYEKAWASAAEQLAEQWWDAYREDRNGDHYSEWDAEWDAMEAMFRGMPEAFEELDHLFNLMIEEMDLTGEDRENLDISTYFKSWSKESFPALQEFGYSMPEEVAAGIESAIPSVSASVAHLVAAIQSAAAAGAGIPGTSTTTNNTTTYIENYNEASRGSYFGQGFREIAAIGG